MLIAVLFTVLSMAGVFTRSPVHASPRRTVDSHDWPEAVVATAPSTAWALASQSLLVVKATAMRVVVCTLVTIPTHPTSAFTRNRCHHTSTAPDLRQAGMNRADPAPAAASSSLATATATPLATATATATAHDRLLPRARMDHLLPPRHWKEDANIVTNGIRLPSPTSVLIPGLGSNPSSPPPGFGTPAQAPAAPRGILRFRIPGPNGGSGMQIVDGTNEGLVPSRFFRPPTPHPAAINGARGGGLPNGYGGAVLTNGNGAGLPNGTSGDVNSCSSSTEEYIPV